MLNMTRLNVFREVVEHGSFSAAADALSYSQSAVSQAIATLEGELGTPLIERRRGGVRPTPAGAALAAHVGGILARMEAAEEEVAAIARGRGGHLRTAAFATAGATLMPRAIAAFRASHPGVEVTLAEGEPEEIAPRLRAGEFDLALLFEFEGVGERLGAGMRRFELADDPLRLALPAEHRLAAPQADRLADLSEEPWVLTSAGERQRQARRPLLPRRRLRAADLLRERRLPDRAGPGRGRGRRRADPPAGARHPPRGHRDPRPPPRQPDAQGVRGDAAGGGGDGGDRDDGRRPPRRLSRRPRRHEWAPTRNRPRERGRGRFRTASGTAQERLGGAPGGGGRRGIPSG